MRCYLLTLVSWFLCSLSEVLCFHPETWGCSVGFVDIRQFILDEIANHTEAKYCDQSLMEMGLPVKVFEGMYTLQGSLFSTEGHRGHQGQHTNGALIMESLKLYNKVPDWTQADLVYVYDYCLKTVVIPSDEKTQNRDLLQIAYNRLIETNKWKEKNGKNFLFVSSHPGEHDLDPNRCYEKHTANAIHAFTEWGMGCPKRKQTDILIPYATNDIVRQDNKFSDRENLLCYLGGVHAKGTFGKRQRYQSVKILQNVSADVLMNDFDQKQVNHRDLMRTYQTCKYCLVLAGDTMSSRRLAEVILGGCIPVFVGPPFHNVWLGKYVPYANFSIFVYIIKREWDYNPDDPNESDEIKFIFPTEAKVYELQTISELPKFLRDFPEQRANMKQMNVLKHQSKFEHIPNPHGNPSAIDVLMTHACGFAKKEEVVA